MNTPEILAPAGGKEQLTAAVRCGADAVYLGTKNFNARQNAENFDAFSLIDAVSYCHGRGVKVYVTVNTLITDSETDSLIAEIENIANSGADAVIIQDIAVAKLFRQHCPDIPLHASTQMTIHNVSGVKMLEKLGFSRVVLARELSFSEIKTIAENTNMELEVFIHGALCMCTSGACYLSSMLGGRSGNRGLCAQPCRLNFKSGSREYALSLKDQSLVEQIGQLSSIGICSFKIEGRMKRPEYVAASVTACRAALRGEKPDIQSLQAVFSRSGFTDEYFTGKRTLDMFGYRRPEDVKASADILSSLSGLYRREASSVPVDMALSVFENKESSLTVSDGTNSVTVSGAIPEQARTVATSYELAFRNLSKTGGTPFVLRSLTSDIGSNLVISPSELNRMRRESLDKLLEMRSTISPYSFIPSPLSIPKHAYADVPTVRIRCETVSQLADIPPEIEKIILPISQILKFPEVLERFPDKIIGELSSLIFPDTENQVKKQLETAYSYGLTEVITGNLGGIELAAPFGFIVHGDYGLNVLNSIAVTEYEKLGLEDITLSFEINSSFRTEGSVKRGIIGYGYLPLMRLRACPIQSKTGCGKCSGHGILKDRKNISFPVVCSDRKYTTLLNSVPLYIADKHIKNIDFSTLYFTTENSAECSHIIKNYLKKSSPDFSRTAGLYFRELK